MSSSFYYASDNTPFTMASWWDTDEPNVNEAEAHDCAVLFVHTRDKLNAFQCDQTYHMVCEISGGAGEDEQATAEPIECRSFNKLITAGIS